MKYDKQMCPLLKGQLCRDVQYHIFLISSSPSPGYLHRIRWSVNRASNWLPLSHSNALICTWLFIHSPEEDTPLCVALGSPEWGSLIPLTVEFCGDFKRGFCVGVGVYLCLCTNLFTKHPQGTLCGQCCPRHRLSALDRSHRYWLPA